EAAEDDGEGSADARAREHRHRKLGDHAHVDPDVRSPLDAQLLERVGEADDVLLELAEGDLLAVLLRLALPEEGDLVLQPALDMAIDAVEADVELAAKKPLGVRGLPLVELGPGFEEGDPLRLGGPEVVHALAVDVRLGVGLLAERGVRAIPALLHLEGLDGVPARAHITHRPSMPGLR